MSLGKKWSMPDLQDFIWMCKKNREKLKNTIHIKKVWWESVEYSENPEKIGVDNTPFSS
jgi:hypothetical protein